jgi:acetylornithine/LysW-gamma-L-lysine aminotransferase
VSTRELLAVEQARESGVFPKRPVSLVRGQGCELWDAEGRAYLDMGASYGVANVGHAHPRVVQAIQSQAARLVHVPQTFANDVRAALFERLAACAPPGLDRAFLCNSGAEAVEAALKFARAHTGRAGLVAAKRAFHGRTMGALSLTFKPEYREPFAPLLPGVQHVSFGDEEALKAVVGPGTAAVFLEPVQGEAGVVVPPRGYLRAARDLCDDAGALLVLDEVQTGVGRTGRMWACAHEGVSPDILCFAKSIAGGVPMGGLLLRGEVCTLPVAGHGTTFGGGPLACAAACAVLDVMREERLAERAAELGPRLLAGLRAAAPQAREVRGLGLMVGLELRGRAAPALHALVEQGVLALPTGSAGIRYLPPLVVSPAQLDIAVAATAKALGAAEA